MKNEGILKAAEVFKEKIEMAHNSNNRSQDILQAIRGFLQEISHNIASGDNISVKNQQESIPDVDQ